MMHDLTEPQINILRMYGPDTYCIDLGTFGSDRTKLDDLGLIQWVPGQAWSGYYTFAITDAGRKELEERDK